MSKFYKHFTDFSRAIDRKVGKKNADKVKTKKVAGGFVYSFKGKEIGNYTANVGGYVY
jgi:hypothetical protein